MTTVTRSTRLCGVVLALAFCASAFAADPSKNVVLPVTQQTATKTVKKMCYTVAGNTRIPQPCERLGAIPTTSNPLIILGTGSR